MKHTTGEKAGAPPLIPEVGVLAFVPDRWGGAWQPRQHVLTRLARYFQVLWVDPARHWRQSLSALGRAKTWKAGPGFPPGFEVHAADPWLPLVYRPQWLARATCHERVRRGIETLREKGCRKIISYIWRPEFSTVLDLTDFDLTCYHIDDEYAFSREDVAISETEALLLQRVDQVFIHSPGLLQKKGQLNPHTSFVPNGVDYALFSSAYEEPEDLRPVPHPRIGYNGFLKQQLEWDLLLALATNHPEWSFVFVGPRSPHPQIDATIQQMKRMENVWFLGPKPWQELAAYAQHFDVCTMPYDQTSAYVHYIFPLKLHEYLATGCPVVGSRIRSLHDFQNVVELATGAEEWASAIRRSLEPARRSPERRDARRAVARGYDWDILVRRIAVTFVERLGLEYHGDLIPAEQAEASDASVSV
jgi:glycosyltransferase involved in cell wall biosynthesis